MKKMTSAVTIAMAAAVLAASSPAAFAQASSTQASSYSPPQTEHKKNTKKPRKPKSSTNGQSQ
ncbi:hypothetical protein [Caballeronia sp. Lep1P3]|uniref:hypothetical protein n=1 Tax=Caballeronia sp. Lep1P3 TaxID=2878150 RepID=UPI001FD48069|nr:hypothetical protein [Caballeronia sp. Lep1P3]